MLVRNSCLFMKVPSELVYAKKGASRPSTAFASLYFSASFQAFSKEVTRALSESRTFIWAWLTRIIAAKATQTFTTFMGMAPLARPYDWNGKKLKRFAFRLQNESPAKSRSPRMLPHHVSPIQKTPAGTIVPHPEQDSGHETENE